MSEYSTIGIDIGGTRIKAALVDEKGNLSNELNEPSYLDQGYPSFITKLKDITQRLRRLSEVDIIGVGLAVAGLMDAKQQVVIDAPNCGILVGQSPPEDLGREIGLTVVMDNDANAMALGEGLSGAAQGSRHYIALTLGTGIGGAVVTDGRLLHGIDGGGGELGHIPIARNGPKCACGARGCLESFIGKAGLRRYIEENHPQFSDTGMKELSVIAEKGDKAARDVFAYLGMTLGIAVAGLVNIFNPELVIVGGGVAYASDLFMEPLREEVKRRAFKSYLGSLQIRPAKLGNWAGVIGAASMIRQ